MRNLIYNIFHEEAVRRNDISGFWDTALATVSDLKYPKCERLTESLLVITPKILEQTSAESTTK